MAAIVWSAEVMTPLIRAFATVLFRQLDRGAFNLVDRADMHAVGANSRR
jgi:hypothetical protein